MKVAVVGSRQAGDQAIRQILQVLPSNASEIVSGGAAGIDTLASQIAHLLKLPIRTFLPDYAQYGKKAPLIRNTEIVRYADLILAFWDGSSHGTQQVVAECIRLHKPVRLISLKETVPSDADGSCV